MTLRTSRALVALLVACAAGACATQGSDSQGGNGLGDDADASTGGHGDDDANGPSPDAIILGVDAPGDDADEATVEPVDAPDDSHASKSCAGLPDGTPCGAAPDICHNAPVCSAGACALPVPKADGFVCASAADDCHTDGTCKAGVCGPVGTRTDGYNWTAGDDTARCCGGKPIHTDVDSDCGACGIQCNASNGESCQLLGGEWFCRGCVASAACWSHCCSTSFTPYSCAASDCQGNCSDTYCPSGTHCVSGGTTSSDYCSY